mgnify:FL=1
MYTPLSSTMVAEVCYLPFGNLKGYIKKENVLIKFIVLLKTGITRFC